MLVSSMDMSPRMEEFFNKYHGKGGRFASGPSGGGLGAGRPGRISGPPVMNNRLNLKNPSYAGDGTVKEYAGERHRAGYGWHGVPKSHSKVTLKTAKGLKKENDWVDAMDDPYIPYSTKDTRGGRFTPSPARGRKIKTNLASAKGFMDRVKLKHQTVKHLKTGAITTVGGKKNPNKGSTTNRMP